MSNEFFAQNLRKRRESLDLSRVELAKKCNTTHTSIGRWETGETKPDIEQAALLAKVFKISIDELFYGNNIQKIKTEEDITAANAVEVLKNLIGKSEANSLIPQDILASIKEIGGSESLWRSFRNTIKGEIEYRRIKSEKENSHLPRPEKEESEKRRF